MFTLSFWRLFILTTETFCFCFGKQRKRKSASFLYSIAVFIHKNTGGVIRVLQSKGKRVHVLYIFFYIDQFDAVYNYVYVLLTTDEDLIK